MDNPNIPEEDENGIDKNETIENIDETENDSRLRNNIELEKYDRRQRFKRRVKRAISVLLLIGLIGFGIYYFLLDNEETIISTATKDTTNINDAFSTHIKTDVFVPNHPNCQVCKGVGTIRKIGNPDCSACKGNGTIICDKCKKGKTICRKCNGAKFVSGLQCPNCWGDGMIDCDFCNGEGHNICKNCKGNGKIIGPINESCINCYGTGVLF